MNSSLLVSEARSLRQNLSSPARNSYDIVSDTTKVSANRRGALRVRWHVTNKVTFIGVMFDRISTSDGRRSTQTYA
jgi:hypothetical protein